MLHPSVYMSHQNAYMSLLLTSTSKSLNLYPCIKANVLIKMSYLFRIDHSGIYNTGVFQLIYRRKDIPSTDIDFSLVVSAETQEYFTCCSL